MPQGQAQVRRVAMIAALCAFAAIGLQARAALPTGVSGWAAGVTGRAFYDVTAAVTGASMVSGLVLFLLLSHYRRKRRRDNHSGAAPLPWWGRLLAVLLMLAVIGGPVVLFVRALYRRRRGPARPALPPALGHAGHALSSNASSGWAFFAGMAFAAAALIAAAVWVRRQRRADDWPDGPPAAPESRPSLRAALSAGTTALREGTDPRASIIGCYAAMESSLAGAGAAPAASDTPDEVLARAAAGGLIRSAAAGELTGLFRQARYGRRDMAETERAAAQGALTRLQADLGGAG